MNEELRRVKELFLTALEKGPDERAAFLGAACGADEALRRQVQTLLDRHEQAGGFLERPAAGSVPTLDPQPGELGSAAAKATGGDDVWLGVLRDRLLRAPAAAEAAGDRVGPYRLLEKLGEGGMGAVWLAEQQEPLKRRVALKVIKPGLDSAQVLRRFEAERQALALMDHPNIAKVLDAGSTAEGRPYFVMELVRGVPITKYCDELHLPIRERLELFLQVCQAIQHAHQKGVIHRDIKPSNVLVCIQDGKPVPKVIDFGVAKALHQPLAEGSLYTEVGAMVGTLAYMAPEQAEVSPLGVDTRADVYALGVLLYQLLTGSTPLTRERLRQAAFAEVVRLIKEEEPARPSARLGESEETLVALAAQRRSEPAKLTKEVRGELDWIVMKALEKDRTRRYETASGFAADVQRYLADEPVEACPPSVGYRLGKAMRRNKKLLVAGAAFVALLVAGTTVSVWQAVLARAGREAADRARAAEEAEAGRARAAEKAAVAADEESRRALARQYVARGAELAEQGNLNEALLWYVEALRKDVAGPEREAMHRLRIAATAQLCPRPVHLLPHAGPVVKLVLSPEGKRLLTVSGGPGAMTPADRRSASRAGYTDSSTEARVWDLTTGKPVTAPMRMPAGIRAALFSPDGKCVLLACFHDGYKAQVWGATTGQPITPLIAVHATGSFTASFSPDGSRLLLVGGVVQRQTPTNPIDEATEVQVWDLAAAKQAVPPLRPRGPPLEAEFSRDGKHILTLSQTTCQLWDAETGKAAGNPLPYSFRHHAFSPDGTQLLVFERENQPAEREKQECRLRVVDVATGQPLGPGLKLRPGTILSGLSPDGRAALLAEAKGGVRLIDPLTGRALFTIQPDANNFMVPHRFSPDGQHLALAVTGLRPDPGGGTMSSFPLGTHLWHARGGRLVPLKCQLQSSDEHEFSADGHKLLVNHASRHMGYTLKESVEVYDADRGDLLAGPIVHLDQKTRGAFSPDSKRLLTWGGSEARVWDAASGQPLTDVLPHQDFVLDAAFLRDHPGFVTAGADGFVRIWGPSPVYLPTARVRPGGHVYGSRLSRDGTRLLVASANPAQSGALTQRLWDVTRGRPLTPPQELRFAQWMGDFAGDGRVLLTWAERSVQLWEAATGRPLHRRIEPADKVCWLAVSPGGRRLAVTEIRQDGKVNEKWVRVWDGNTGKPVTEAFAKCPAGTSLSCQFSPGGRRLLVVSGTPRHAQLWAPDNAQALTPPIPCSEFAFSADGRRLMTTADGKSGKTWDVETGAFLADCDAARFQAERAQGRMILTREGREAQLSDATTGRPLAPPMKPRRGVAYAGLLADGRFAVTLGHPTWRSYGRTMGLLARCDLRLWDATTGESVLPSVPINFVSFGVPPSATAVQMTPDGRKLVFCSDTVTCDVWDLPREQRPVEELVALAQALSGRRVDDAGGTPPLGPDEWLALRARYPETGAAPFDPLRWYDEQAEKAETVADWQTARDYLDRLIAVQPDVWLHYRRRGRADGNLNDWAAGLRDNTRAIELGANVWNVWHNRGIAHLALGHFKEAGDDLEKAAGMEGVWPLTWFNLAEARAFQGDAAGYRRACTGLLRNFGRYSLSNVVWNCCLAPGGAADGNVLIRLAEQDRSTAAEQDRPKGQNAEGLAGARTALGAALYRADKYQEAITVLTENKDVHGAYDGLFLAMAHHRLGQKRRAEKYLNESLDWIDRYADDSQKGPFFTRGAAWNRRQQLRRLGDEAAGLIWGPAASARVALRLAEKAHARNPDDANACNNLAWNLAAGPEALRDPARALPLAEKAVKLRPGDWGYHNTLGVTLYRLGRYKDAVAALETSLQHQEKQFTAFDLYFLAMCHHRLGEEGRAKEEYKRAVQAQEQNAQALNSDNRAELQAFRLEAEALLKKP
jgi:serine/threonine protein kinase/WD40 repeat protein/Flp pilus assembly protein TadD